MNFEDVRDLAREFPDVVEGTVYGSPAILLGKRMVACIPSNKSAEPGSLAVRTDFEEREALLREDPGTYYLPDHYVNHPVVLVRFARLKRDQLRDLLASARRFVIAHEKAPRKRKGL